MNHYRGIFITFALNQKWRLFMIQQFRGPISSSQTKSTWRHLNTRLFLFFFFGLTVLLYCFMLLWSYNKNTYKLNSYIWLKNGRIKKQEASKSTLALVLGGFFSPFYIWIKDVVRLFYIITPTQSLTLFLSALQFY